MMDNIFKLAVISKYFVFVPRGTNLKGGALFCPPYESVRGRCCFSPIFQRIRTTSLPLQGGGQEGDGGTPAPAFPHPHPDPPLEGEGELGNVVRQLQLAAINNSP